MRGRMWRWLLVGWVVVWGGIWVWGEVWPVSVSRMRMDERGLEMLTWEANGGRGGVSWIWRDIQMGVGPESVHWNVRWEKQPSGWSRTWLGFGWDWEKGTDQVGPYGKMGVSVPCWAMVGVGVAGLGWMWWRGRIGMGRGFEVGGVVSPE